MKQDLYQKITDQIVEALETGVAPWHKPWNAGLPVTRPLRSTGEPYSGVNVLVLWATSMTAGYTSPFWFTYKQAKEKGGQVRRGEKSTTVVYANRFTKTEVDETTGEEIERTIPFLKGYAVFNANQIDGLPEAYYARPEPQNEDDKIAHADQFFAATGADIRQGGDMAAYSVTGDYIMMPEFETFKNAESYYATLAHETTHWTRHPSRLERDFGRKRWGDEGYAMEELVAELGAAFLSADLGITAEPREDHAAYIKSWLKVLANDKRAIFTAASHAQKAVDFLHGFQGEVEASVAA